MTTKMGVLAGKGDICGRLGKVMWRLQGEAPPSRGPGGAPWGWAAGGLGFPFQHQCFFDPVGQSWGFVAFPRGAGCPPRSLCQDKLPSW